MRKRVSLLLLTGLVVAALAAPQTALAALMAEPAGAMAAQTAAVQPQGVVPEITRRAGSDRFDTAVKISKAYFPSADTVIVGTGMNWPDPLCASPLAAAKDAPLLLVLSNSLPSNVRNEIIRLGPSEIIVLGGKVSISDGVVNALKGIPGVNTVRRVAGNDRYETAAKIAEELHSLVPTAPADAFIATGLNFPDALSASPIAAHRAMPILLTQPSGMPNATKNVLKDVGTENAYIIGGYVSVGPNVDTQLAGMGITVLKRFNGVTRYDTSADLVECAAAQCGTDLSNLGMASGANFPDALAASAVLGSNNRALLLTNGTKLLSPTETYLKTLRGTTTAVELFGGKVAVTEKTEGEIAVALGFIDVPPPPSDAFVDEVLAFASPLKPVPGGNVTLSATCLDQYGKELTGAQVQFILHRAPADGGDLTLSGTTGSNGSIAITHNVGTETLNYMVEVDVRAKYGSQASWRYTDSNVYYTPCPG